MKVLLTGATGYIGKHVLNELKQRGLDVVATTNQRDIEGDYVYYNFIECGGGGDSIIQKVGIPDVTIHLAYRNGFSHQNISHIEDLPLHLNFIRNMYEAGCFNINILGTMHEVGYYEGMVTKHTHCNPTTLYGIARNALRKSLDSLSIDKVKWMRGFYIYGDDGYSSSIFGKLYRSASKGISNFPLTLGNNKFDFIYIKDLAEQIVSISLQSEFFGIINTGSGIPVSLRDMVLKYIDDNKLKIIPDFGKYPERQNESSCIYADTTIVNKILNSEK